MSDETVRTKKVFFDPLLAIHTSVLDPLPHQITAVLWKADRRIGILVVQKKAVSFSARDECSG